MLPLENDAFALRLTEAGTLLLRWKEKNREFETLPSAYPVTRATAETGSLELDLDCGGFALHASFTLPESGGVQLRLDGDGPMPEEIAWPPAWKMEPGDVGIYPFGTGYAVPAAELEFPLPGRMAFYAGNQASMSLFGFLRDGLCVLTGVECGSDAELDNAPFDGLRHSRVVWKGEKGQWGYARAIRYFFAEGLAPAAARYRAWRESQGMVETLQEKCRHTPELEKLIGAADFWLWDDNNMNRLYGRPEEPERTPRNVRHVADDLRKLGMDRLLWNSFEGETPEDCAELKRRGCLVGKYDIYRDVLPKPCVDQIIPYRVKRSVNTKQWPGIVRVDRDGNLARAWQVHGLDGKLYPQHAVCDIPALKLTMENVPPDVEKVGYNSRFIDVQAGSILAECYHVLHPATRSDSLRYINTQLRFLADIGLVCGVEVGSEATAAAFHFSEGMLSPSQLRAPDAGRRMTTQYRGEEIPPQIRQYMLNPRYRIPLWELVYHDCVVSYWYWGDSSNSVPELMPLRDLFDALYGEPPLYSLSASQWEEQKEEIAASYARATKVARRTGFARMVSFEYLTPDRLVQKTRFSNGISVTANFSTEEYRSADGLTLGKWEYALEEPPAESEAQLP